MKKRILAVLVLSAVAVSVLGGCTSKPSSSAGTSGSTGTSASTSKAEDNKEAEGLGYDKIIVGLDDTFAPMGFRDEKGELTGLDIDLAKATSEVMGIPFELQPIDWTMKETELNNGNVDLIWNGYTITDARKEQVLFTNPYLNNRQIAVVMADSEINTFADLAGKTVAAQEQSSAIDAIDSKPEVRDTFAEVVTFKTNDECLRDMEAGRSQAVVADEVLLRYYISQKGPEKYKVLEEDFGDEEYGIGARKDDQALVDAINTALETLKENGKAAEISEKYFGENIIK